MELNMNLNPESRPVNTKNINSIGERFIFREHVTELDASEGVHEVVLFETTEPFIMEYGEWSANGGLGYVSPALYTPVNTNDVEVDISKVTSTSFTSSFRTFSAQFSQVYRHGSSLYDVINYDEGQQKAKMVLKKPLYFPKGLKLAVKCTSETSTIITLVGGRIVK